MKGDGVEEGGVKEEGVGRGRGGGSAVPPEPPPSQLSPCQAHSCLPPASLSDSSQLNFMAGTSPPRLPVWSTMPFFFLFKLPSGVDSLGFLPPPLRPIKSPPLAFK